MKPCVYRFETDYEGWFLCAHSKVSCRSKDGFVLGEDCNKCQWWKVVDPKKRRLNFDLEPPSSKKRKIQSVAKKPGVIRMAWDVAEALASFVYHQGRTVTIEQYKNRLLICSGCTERHVTGYTCNLCGCNLLIKASSPDFHCDKDYWPKLLGKGKTKLLLRALDVSPGDIVMLTAAVRDLCKAHGAKFEIGVETVASELWENNPYISKGISRKSPGVKVIDCHYDLIHQSNDAPYHFVHGYRMFLEKELSLEIPATEFKGDIYLSDEEKSWVNQVREQKGWSGPFWLVVGGGKGDYTCKWPSFGTIQKVVDHFRKRIIFVQVGESHGELKDLKKGEGRHWHPSLKNIINLVGKTDIRQLIRLVYHADGVVCPVTFLMHLAAAVEVPKDKPRNRPCVVVAGGREPMQWEVYPHHQYISVNGALSCCENGGCWKSRAFRLGDGDEKDEDLCEKAVKQRNGISIPLCMKMITAGDIIRRIEYYLEGRKNW